MTEPYRPANGTEGEWFMQQFCFQCAHDSEDGPCEILGWTFAVEVDHPKYPKEWIEENDTPRCTAFEHRGEGQ